MLIFIFIESYEEDYSLAANLTEVERKSLYRHMKAGAESGWDYSSRWFTPDKEELLGVQTGNIIPVDLNSFLCRNAEIMEQLFTKVERPEKAREYARLREGLKSAIR